VLVNGFDAWVETPRGSFALTSQRYAPDVVHPDGARRVERFDAEPWPRWSLRLEDGTRIEQEILLRHGEPLAGLGWRLETPAAAGSARLFVRLFFSGRDYHALHHENAGFRFEPEILGRHVRFRPYPGVLEVHVLTNGSYRHAPEWYRNFLYTEERDRGLDAVEDLASPGVWSWDLGAEEAVLLLSTREEAFAAPDAVGALESALYVSPARAVTADVSGAFSSRVPDAVASFGGMRSAERARRGRFPTPLHRASDAYLVQRGRGRTVVAGYPWFTDWGRDTFIALRGLCLAAGRLAEAEEILVEWASVVSHGMLPNRFPDGGETPEYNSVDASLWYAVAVHEFREQLSALGRELAPESARRLDDAVQAILRGYAEGTRFRIHADADGLLAAGEPGWQLTWMDAKVGDHVITPRIGKPVEVQALWLNALWIGSRMDSPALAERWQQLFERGLESFRSRFWNVASGCLYDVVDADHEPGRVDASLRPNQIYAVGGLPLVLLPPERARAAVDVVERELWTPLGLRSLARGEPGYAPRYAGGVWSRDSAYHQGTVWPYLTGPFIEAWVRVRGATEPVRAEARARFLEPLLRHLTEAGIGHVSEIADAEPPHTPRGCPFQAWSVGELLRLRDVVGAERDAGRPQPAELGVP
jgi:glycogen debranching enzyme